MLQVTRVRHAWPNPAGFCLNRPNGHRDYTFVHFTTSVELRLGGEDITVPEHACILYRPGTPQYFRCPNGMLHDFIHFINMPQDLLQMLHIPTDVLLFPRQWSFITPLIEEIETEFFAKKDCGEYLIDLKLRELFVKLGRSLKGENIEINNEKFAVEIRKLRAKMIQFPSRAWTVAEMAGELHLSESRFAHLYRSFFGTTPLDDLIHARMDAAKNELLFTNRAVYEIAEALGYRNTTHFCRQFKQLVGISPTEYRRDRT